MQKPALYPLPAKSIDLGESFRLFKFPDHHFVPTYHQWRLMAAVKSALDIGLFYTTDVYAHVVEKMADILNPELLAKNNTNCKVANGYFGLEIYYMREVVKTNTARERNVEAFTTLKGRGMIGVGSILKGPYQRHGKTFSKLEVLSLDAINGVIEVHGVVRGSKYKHLMFIGGACPKLQALLNPKANPLSGGKNKLSHHSSILTDGAILWI